MFFACGVCVLLLRRSYYTHVSFGATLSATPCCAQTPQGFSIVTPNKQYFKLEK